MLWILFDHVVRGLCNLTGKSISGESWWVTTLPSFIPIGLPGNAGIFNLLKDLRGPRDWKIMWLYKQELLKVCQQPAKLVGHNMYCVSEDVFNLWSDFARPKD